MYMVFIITNCPFFNYVYIRIGVSATVPGNKILFIHNESPTLDSTFYKCII
jgi:hypothetical protein